MLIEDKSDFIERWVLKVIIDSDGIDGEVLTLIGHLQRPRVF